jgi:tRNA-splicing ligase RtcB (3'-phosphate/5'-hydroxy nucleic acid ligase)
MRLLIQKLKNTPMGKRNIKAKDLSKIGYVNDVSRSMAITLASRQLKHVQKQEVLELLSKLKESPELFLDDPIFSTLAQTFIEKTEEQQFIAFDLLQESRSLKIYGGKEIDGNAKRQMEMALRLPVSVRGALMPDAHVGFGLPVGGVLATENAIIPYAVGVDIGCRMALSIFDLQEKFLQMNTHALKTSLKKFTHFGMDGGLEFSQEHEILDRKEFQETELLRKLHGKAVKQLGSSGSGNHFVEWGLIELFEQNTLGIRPGKYMALLSHSGSRGLGATVAKYYTQIAMDTCKLPKEAQPMAWLSLDSEAGQEYLMSMNLAGDYAKACHDRIHANLSKAIGEKPVARVENHHNFAWEDVMSDGKKVIIHRKGATPAHNGELGIIPGSMTAPGYLVSGKGNTDSLYSASHGAGRRLSRGKAKETFTVSSMKKLLSNAQVDLIGGSPEECPLAYKDIEAVMNFQQELVDVHGKFFPKIVRMNKE